MKRLQLFGPINTTGYGHHFCNWASALIHSGEHDISIYPIGQTEPGVDNYYGLRSAIEAADYFDPRVPSIKLWHDNDMASFAGSPRIAYTVFELDNLTERGWSHLASCDEVWVVSNWAREILSSRIDENKIEVVPEGVNHELFSWKKRELDTPKFVNVGKLEKRKGHMVILKAIPKLEGLGHEADFYFHWTNPFLRPESVNEMMMANGWAVSGSDSIMNLYKHPELNSSIYMPKARFKDPKDVKLFIEHGNIGLYPYFAEGWNLPLMETMSLGIPCIATDYSGPTEYLTSEVAELLTKEGYNCSNVSDGFRGNGQEKIGWKNNHLPTK